MHMRKPGRQHSVATKSENDSWRAEDVGCDKSEGRNGCAREKKKTSGVAEKFTCCFGQRRDRIIRQLIAERALRDELNRNVKHGRDGKREIDRAWHGAGRVLNFAAGDERDFGSNER